MATMTPVQREAHWSKTSRLMWTIMALCLVIRAEERSASSEAARDAEGEALPVRGDDPHRLARRLARSDGIAGTIRRAMTDGQGRPSRISRVVRRRRWRSLADGAGS